MFAASLAVAALDTVIPLFIGRLVSLMEAADRMAALREQWPMLIGMIALVLVVRPLVLLADIAIRHMVLIPGATSLIRWQSHWHVIRQSWPFFQNDFAGRIANRVMQTAHALRESVMASIRAVWYIGAYGVITYALMAMADWRLGVPTLVWFAGYLVFLWHFVPRMRDLARKLGSALARHGARGRQLHQRAHGEALRAACRRRRVCARVDRRAPRCHAPAYAAHHALPFRPHRDERRAPRCHRDDRHLAVGERHRGRRSRRRCAAAHLAARERGRLGELEVTAIFENVGVVQEGMQSIAVPHSSVDQPGAQPLEVSRGEIRFEHVRFGYGRPRRCSKASELRIKPGERVGLVGRSGAGKSTIVNLLLRFFDLEKGRILIDSQDISQVTQESLRAAIGVVTQDTSLLHRSIAANIHYGRPRASDEEVIAAAKRRRMSSSSAYATGAATPATRRTSASAA